VLGRYAPGTRRASGPVPVIADVRPLKMKLHLRRGFWLYLRIAIVATVAMSVFTPFEGNSITSQTIDVRKDYLWIGMIAFLVGCPVFLFLFLMSIPSKPDYCFRSLILSAPLGISGRYAFSSWTLLSLLVLLMGILEIPYSVWSGQWILTLFGLFLGATLLAATFLAYFSKRQLA